MEYVLATILVISGYFYTLPNLFYFFSGMVFLWYVLSKKKLLKNIAILTIIAIIYTVVVQIVAGNNDYMSAISFVIHIILNIVLMIWMANNIEKLNNVSFLFSTAIIMLVLSVFAFTPWGSGLWKVQEYKVGVGPERLRLLFAEPAYLSIVCGGLLLLCVYDMLARPFRKKVLLSAIVYSLCMIMTLGLGGIIACFVAAFVLIMLYLVYNRNDILSDPMKKLNWILAVVVLIVALFFLVWLSPVYFSRIEPIFQGNDDGFAYTLIRPLGWLHKVLNYTHWRGTGIGGLIDTDLGAKIGIAFEFKNSFFKVMAEGGILGIILVSSIVLYLLARSLLFGNELAIAFTLYVVIIQFATGNFENPIYWIAYGIILYESKLPEKIVQEQLKMTSGNKKNIKICLVGSSGGHLTHLYMLKPLWENTDRFWVTFDKEDAKSLLENEKMIPCYYPTNRSIKGLIINSWLAIKVLRKERPDLIISTGAAVAVPFFYFGKLFGAKCIYIEVFDRIDKSTMSGKMVYPIADAFIVQWEEMKKVYPNAINLGSIF